MKSHERDLLELAVCILKDATAKCTANQLEARDVETMTKRIENEGLSFLTITLPSIGKDLEQALADGRIGSTHFRSFRKYGKAPAFLRGFFTQIFDSSTGGILDEPKIEAIEGVRQIAYTFKKLEVPCAPERVRKAYRAFIQDEHDLKTPVDKDVADYFCNVSNVLWSSLVTSGNLSDVTSFVPKHGPGATAEHITGNNKYVIQRWHERLESYFPMLHNAFINENVCETKEFENVTLVSEGCEQPVRVIAVPKTLKTPRIIAIEPVCMQYTQQAISSVLVSALERHPITSGHVNFTCQEVNGSLAMTASANGKYATLDLSAASDRVPYALAIRMFDCNPDLQGAVSATRSTQAQVPGEEIVQLQKFAAMGSALCFPVESMYFYTICVGTLLKKRGLSVTYRNAMLVSRDVFVYGDDIIVPSDDAVDVMNSLHDHMCKVNTSKSFWTGKFRESCGVDAYDGHNVTPTYVRRLPPNNIREASSLLSWAKASNAFYKRGYWLTASHLIQRCEAYLGALPIVGPDCAGLGKVSFQPLVSSERWNVDHQVHEVRTWVAVPVYQTDPLDGYQALLKCLMKAGSTEPSDVKHLERSVRHGAVALKRRWVRPY